MSLCDTLLIRVGTQAITLMRDVNPPGHGGRVLNISSVGGYIGNATRGFYNSAKFGQCFSVTALSPWSPMSHPVHLVALEGFTEAFTKEMLPEWNIKAVIIEPGGFATEWSKSSMVHFPVPSAYDKPHAPSVRFRQMTAGATVFTGDPRKAARAMVEVAGMADPPLRVQLGTDSLTLVRNQARHTLMECDRVEELAHSTNMEGVDRTLVMENLSAANL